MLLIGRGNLDTSFCVVSRLYAFLDTNFREVSRLYAFLDTNFREVSRLHAFLDTSFREVSRFTPHTHNSPSRVFNSLHLLRLSYNVKLPLNFQSY
ncbi:Uncharacterised protein [Staphylococcus piscifermentans]|nr:Uncharacterised protein [Staphylococcus piscifermentans]